jgi:hypothetical protein
MVMHVIPVYRYCKEGIEDEQYADGDSYITGFVTA